MDIMEPVRTVSFYTFIIGLHVFDFVTEAGMLCIVMDYCDGGI